MSTTPHTQLEPADYDRSLTNVLRCLKRLHKAALEAWKIGGGGEKPELLLALSDAYDVLGMFKPKVERRFTVVVEGTPIEGCKGDNLRDLIIWAFKKYSTGFECWDPDIWSVCSNHKRQLAASTKVRDFQLGETVFYVDKRAGVTA